MSANAQRTVMQRAVLGRILQVVGTVIRHVRVAYLFEGDVQPIEKEKAFR